MGVRRRRGGEASPDCGRGVPGSSFFGIRYAPLGYGTGAFTLAVMCRTCIEVWIRARQRLAILTPLSRFPSNRFQLVAESRGTTCGRDRVARMVRGGHLLYGALQRGSAGSWSSDRSSAHAGEAARCRHRCQTRPKSPPWPLGITATSLASPSIRAIPEADPGGCRPVAQAQEGEARAA